MVESNNSRNKLKLLILLVIIGLAAGIAYQVTASRSGACNVTTPDGNKAVIVDEEKGNDVMSGAAAVSTADFDKDVLQADQPVLVDFWAPWCGPCKMLGPVIDELANDYAGKVKVVKVNVDDNQSLANQYGVRGIPTLIIFKNGEPVAREVGVQPKQALSEKLDKALSD